MNFNTERWQTLLNELRKLAVTVLVALTFDIKAVSGSSSASALFALAGSSFQSDTGR